MNLWLHFTIFCTIYVLYTAGGYPGGGSNIYRSNCRSDATFRLVATNTRLDASMIAQDIVQTVHQCMNECIHASLCKSINYNAKTKKCEKLSADSATVGSSKLVASNSWEHYEPGAMQPVYRRRHQLKLCGVFERYVDDCNKPGGIKCIGLQNIALGKAAANEPNNPDRPPSRAVDGNADTDFLKGHCAHSGPCCSPLAWWRVDFGGTAVVNAINITNRGDCCGHRLLDFNIRIGDSNVGSGELNAMFKQNLSIPQGARSTFICDPPMHGRYLYIQTNLREPLALCEVEVFGEIL